MSKPLKKVLIGEFSLKRLMISLVLVPLFVYFGLLIVAYFFADRVIFQPQVRSYADSADILKLTTPSGETISAKFYENPNATHTILFSHGNAEDIGVTDSILTELQASGFAVFVYDYRGYGTSGGSPSEENAYEDVQAAYRYLTNELKIPPERIIAHGRSLGSAIAIDLASREKVGGMIVESSFISAFRVLTRIQIAPFDKFDNLSKIKNVGCPVLFIHGRRDAVIPFWHGEQLFTEANEPKFSLWIDEAGHNDVFNTAGNAYLKAIRDFGQNLAPKPID